MTDESPAQKLYAQLVAEFASRRGVLVGSGDRKAFGSGALKVNGKIFAMLSSRQKFVVKLPRQRVAELAAGGSGVQFDPGHGRLMKEWLEVAATDGATWRTLALEALSFVADGHAPKKRDA